MPPPYLQTRSAPVLTPNPDAENVGAGKKALFRVPVGVTYLESILVCTVGGDPATRDQIEADIEYVRVTLDAKEKINLTGLQLAALAEFFRDGSVGDTGNLPIFFRRSWMQLMQNQEGPRWGTQDVGSFQIEVKLASGADIDGLRLQHRQENASPLGTHNKLLVENHPYAAVGTLQIFDLPRDPANLLFGLHIQTDPDHVTRILLKADGFAEWDVTPADLLELYGLETSKRTPQDGFIHLDFSMRNNVADCMPLTMQKLELAITFDAAPGNVPIILDTAVPSDTKAAQASRG